MYSSKLCPQCKTGQIALKLDTHSCVCPYINCHNGQSCSKFEKLDSPPKKSFRSRFFKKQKDI